MPNHCSNAMSVQGTKEDIQEFIDAITITDDKGMTDYRLVNIHPMPEALVGTDSPTPASPEPHKNWANLLAKGEITQEWHDELVSRNRERYERGQKALAETGYTDWYAWCLDNWGTKWGDYDSNVDVEEDGDNVSIIYTTAWSPLSDKFMTRLAERFPRLTVEVRYEEMGMDYCGLILCKDGKLVYSGYKENISDSLQPNDGQELTDEDYEEYWEKQRDLYDEAFEEFEKEGFAQA